MRKLQFAAATAVLAVAAALAPLNAGAQQAKAATKGTAQHDSLKAVKKSLKANKAARKAAKASGDTARAKALKKQIKSQKQTKDALKAESGKAPPKKPNP